MWIVSASVTPLTFWRHGSAQALWHLLEVAACFCAQSLLAPRACGAWYPSSFLTAAPISHLGTTLGGLCELWTNLCFAIWRENVTWLLEYVVLCVVFFFFTFKCHSSHQWPHLTQHSSCLKEGNYTHVTGFDIAGECRKEGTPRETKCCYLSKQKVIFGTV